MCISLDDPNEHREPTPHTGEKLRGSAQALDDVTRLCEEEGGRFFMHFDKAKGEWFAGLEWGSEAPYSPMYGAAAYGVDKVAAAAVEMALREAGR